MKTNGKKKVCGNGDFLYFQTRKTKKIFAWTESCESSFLLRREANRIENGICNKWGEKNFSDENLTGSFYVNLNLKNKN